MSTSPAFFCDICGAALAPEATTCYACGQDIDLSFSPLFEPLASTPLPLRIVSTPLPAIAPRVSIDDLPYGYLLANRYSIICQIGAGGFGKVYKAKDRQVRNGLVAIKQINLQALSPKEIIEATDSYNREVMHLSKLHHENLPSIHAHFTDAGHWYVVMDFIDGETLEDLLKKRRNGRLSYQTVLSIGVALCNVLEYLHSQRPAIIFRDVKPANIMMTRSGHIYLIDFGIARRYTPGQARDTGPLGSPGFAAPEQYGRAQTNEQTDIYGLGATLQTLLTGKDPLELVNAPRARRHIHRKLQPLINQMLERDPVQRPKNVVQVRNSLLYLRDTPQTAAASRVASRVIRFIKYLLPFLFTLLTSHGLRESIFFPLYLGTLALGTIVYIVIGLISEREENGGHLSIKDILVFISSRTTFFVRFSLAVVCFFWALNTSMDGPYWSAYLFLAQCIAVIVVIVGLYYIFNQFRHIHAMVRMRREQANSASIFQQQMSRW